jgi:hypothetical protein
MAKRPDSVDEYVRKRKERQGQPEAETFTRGQRDDRDTYIKRGQEAWHRHKNNATWNDWLAIGEALQIGRQDAMAAAGTNQPAGSKYNAVFGEWLARHQFDDIDKSDRSRLMEVMDNLAAVNVWRETLTQTARLRYNHPNTVLRKWKATVAPKKPKDESKPTLRDTNIHLSEELETMKAHVAELEAARESDVVSLALTATEQIVEQIEVRARELSFKEKRDLFTRIANVLGFGNPEPGEAKTKKRGRPKGSKNKPKAVPQEEASNAPVL